MAGVKDYCCKCGWLRDVDAKGLCGGCRGLSASADRALAGLTGPGFADDTEQLQPLWQAARNQRREGGR